MRPEDDGYRIAVHECGHGAVMISLGQTFDRLTLETVPLPHGVERRGRAVGAGEIVIGQSDRAPAILTHGLAGLFQMAIQDGGRAASALLGAELGRSDDDQQGYAEGLAMAVAAGMVQEQAEGLARHLSEGAVRHWQAAIRVAARTLVRQGVMSRDCFLNLLLTVPRAADDPHPEWRQGTLSYLIADVLPRPRPAGTP